MDRLRGQFSRASGAQKHESVDEAVVPPRLSNPHPSMMHVNEENEDVYGLRELWPGELKGYETSIDIIAIHGLNGHIEKTWTENDSFWLRDFLPTALLEQARIFSYGYNSQIAFSGTASRVDDYARSLLERIRAKRRAFHGDERPIIFICHSLGGIVLKKALIIAHEKSDRYSSISRDTFGVMFMGTPHRGSDIAFWGKLFGTMADILTAGSIRTQLLKDLQPKSSCLGDICLQFVERSQTLRIFTIYERLKIRGVPSLVVDKDSAMLLLPNETAVPIEADHRSMCRFSSEKSEKFQLVLDCLRELVEDALEQKQPHFTSTRSSFVDSLNIIDPDILLRQITRPSPGTCAWITTNELFTDWRDVSTNKILWISGIPGVGKTTLMRYVIEIQRRWLQKRTSSKANQSLVAFFFCSSDDPLRKSYASFLRSILYQILSQRNELFRYLDDSTLEQYIAIAGEEQDNPSEIGIEILRSTLLTILQRSKEVNFWIFVDATDELAADSRDALFKLATDILEQDVIHKIKLVFSDRVVPFSRRFRSRCNEIEMHGSGETGKDVHRFISTKIEDLCTDGIIPWQHQTEIEETFMELSEGNFLQASLAWKNFYSGVSYWSPRVIKTRLENIRKISKEATAYYCSLLERIPEDSQKVARQGFTWVLGSRKPLNVSELQHAVAIGAGQNSWADLVESLGFNFEVQFDQAFGYLLKVEPDHSVRFTHTTIKELLTSPPQNLSPSNSNTLAKFAIRECDIDAELAKACIIILSFRDFGRLRNIAQQVLTEEVKEALGIALNGVKNLKNVDFSKYDDGNDSQGNSDGDGRSSELRQRSRQGHLQIDHHSLFSYCVAHWNYHCSQGGSSSEVVVSLTRFASLRQSYFSHLVAMLLGKAKVYRGAVWDSIDQFARVPPLHLMMRIGDHPAVVENLIGRGQNPNGTDSSGWSPLVWAALENRLESLQMLLAQEATIVSLHGSNAMADGAIHLACKGGANTSIIQRLIDDPRADINAKGRDGWTVLHWCLSRAHLLSITQSLLARKDLDVNIQDSHSCTYLDKLFHDGQDESTALKLVSRWDMPSNWFHRDLARNPRNLNEERPQMSFLHTASVLRWHAIEKSILLTQPFEALQPEPDGMNLLERYAFHGIEDGLRDVLEALPGISLHANSRLLQLCAQQDWEIIVEQLRVKFDVDDTVPDTKGRTIAHLACEFQWRSIISLVKNKSPSWLNQQRLDGKTALHVAAEHRNKLACEALLEAGADYMIRDNNQQLPIHVAAEEGHGSIVRLFLKQPFHRYGKDEQGRHLLHLLVMWQSDFFIRQCLKHLPWKIDVVDKSRRSPLHYAAIFDNWAALKILLEIGSNPNAKDGFGNLPIHYALSSGSRSCVQSLLLYGADLHSLNMFQRNALHLALASENVELIDFVLEELGEDAENLRIQIHQKDRFGGTLLCRICEWNTSKHKPIRSYQDDEDEDIDELMFDIDLYDTPGYIKWKMVCDRVRKYIRIFKALGADVNTQDKSGDTPLHVATRSGNEVAVKTLSEFEDIDVSIRDGNGYTLLDWAMVDGRRSIAKSLRQRGAQHSDDWKTSLKPLYTPWVDELTIDEGAPEAWSLAIID
ncbi:hypothetical protein VTL71DRAFT_13609 [Oculimacula yallundae]|uniref:Nephrocystin 3-like N-terminal domain-containing protein n=1 Tax=Oculimacula yallundae TaxID=86028 RepID=A0ABR4CMT9_9HELO